MAKTANAVNPRGAKFEIVITAAIVAALGSVTTAETIDISSIAKGITGGGITRAVTKEYVTGDKLAIADYDSRIDQGALTLTILYTNGKDTLGTDNLDIAKLFKDIAEYTDADLSLQLIWSVAGGAIGDEERLTDASETFVSNVSDPVGGADTNGKVQMQIVFDTPSVTIATVS